MQHETVPPLFVELLGSLRATVGQRELELGPPKQRALFALLAIRHNQVVSRTELIDGIWGERSPDSVRGIIHTYVSKLRQTLANGRETTSKESILASIGSGYRLRIEHENSDAWLFENTLRQGNELRLHGDVDNAVSRWTEGLSLWRGEPLMGLPGPFAEAERIRLGELRITAIEDRAESLLSLGRESDIVDLGAIVEERPHRERLRAILMVALYRGGRQAEALEHYERLRRLLADELGVDPGAEAQEVYRKILTNDPALAGVRERPVPQLSSPPDRTSSAAARTPRRTSPYPGLASFATGNAQYFFGREQLTTTLVDRLGDPEGASGPVTVVGASGSGKSSLLRAGLIPSLDGMDLATPRRWSWLLITPGSKPVTALAASLARATGRPQEEILRHIRSESGELADILLAQAPAPDRRLVRLVVIIDQFEELFTLCESEAERQCFVRALLTVCAPASVVFAVRADFYGHCAGYPELIASLERSLVVGPMSGAELREAIQRPAELAGLELEAGLSDLLLRDLGAEENKGANSIGLLPLLAHALLAIWQVRDGDRLTLHGYAKVGGIQKAIANTAETTYARFDPFGRDSVRLLLLRMVQVGEGIEVARRSVDRLRLINDSGDPDTAVAVLEALARARLVTLDEDTAEISHEVLLRSWPRLRGWIEENREGLRLHQQLSQDANAWRLAANDESMLYRGARLAIAANWLENLPDQRALAPVEREFVAASTVREDDERLSVHRRARRLWQLTAALTVLLLVAIASMVFAFTERGTALRQRADATSRQVSLRVNSLLGSDPALAAQLSVAAYGISPTTEARGSLLTTSGLPSATRLLGHTDGVAGLAFTKNGSLLASAGKDKTVRLWDGHTHDTLGVAHTTSPAFAVAFSPDGRLMVSGESDGTVRLWDVSSPTNPIGLASVHSHTNGVATVAFSPDGQSIASGAYDKTVRLWRIDAQRHLTSVATLSGHDLAVTTVAFSPDGQWLASGSYDDTVRLWNVGAARFSDPVAVLSGHTSAVTAVAFSPDGHLLASASYDKTVRLWDTSTPASTNPITTLTGATSFLEAVAFNPDGRTVAAGGDDHNTLLWDVSAHVQIGSFTSSATIRAVAFSPDGGTVAVGAANWVVTLWDVRAAEVQRQANSAWGMAFDKSGKVLASGHYDGTVRLWDTTDPQQPAVLGTMSGHTGAVTSVAFSPNGKVLASGSYDHTVRLWDITNPHQPRQLSAVDASTAQIESVSFSPDGRVMASAGDDHLIRLWDVSDTARVTEIGTPLVAHTDVVSSVAFGADKHILASGSYDSTVRLWDVSDPQHPAVEARLTTSDAVAIRGIALSPDGRALAGAGDNHAVELWDIANPTSPAVLSSLTDHTNTVTSVAFSTDGRTLASASWDHTVSIWDIGNTHTPTLVSTLSGPADSVTSVALDPRGGGVAAGVANSQNFFWQTDPVVVRHRICAMRGTPLSATEWNGYVQYDSPVDPCAGAR